MEHNQEDSMDLDVFFDPFLMENPELIDYDITLPTAQVIDPATQYQHVSGTTDVPHDVSLASPPVGPSHIGVDTSRLLESPQIVESFPVAGPQNDFQEPLTNISTLIQNYSRNRLLNPIRQGLNCLRRLPIYHEQLA